MTVYYLTATAAQLLWGDVRDPRGVLDTETPYTVTEVQATSLVPLYALEAYPGDWWNSACFEVTAP
jgi:hypothetical protein